MPIPQMPGAGISSLDDVINYVTRLERELRFLMESGLDSTNIFEAGGWRVNPNQMSSLSGQVGMSSAGSLGSSIRFWAGASDPTAAPFRVQEDGTMYATNGNFTGTITGSVITGGTLRTAASGARVEVSSNSLSTYAASGSRNGPSWGSSIGGGKFGDTTFYHEGVELLNIYDGIDHYTIMPGSGAGSMNLGVSGKTTYANGAWSFSSSTSLSSSTTIGSVSSTEISYLSGVTSGIQSQLNSKSGSFSGYSGTVYVITAVDFVGQTTSAVTLNFSNGILTSVT